jgi:hypothetical protein
MTSSWSIIHNRIEEHVIPGKRLGRHFRFDSRSLAYPYLVARAAADLADQLHPRRIPILDQGDLGSCTGNAFTGMAGTSPFFEALPAGLTLDESFAVKMYSQATKDDSYPGSYPPDDTGSDGTAVCTAGKADGYISGFTHATSVNAMADALQVTPLIVGVSWYEGFDNPDSSGLVTISGSVRGGHEFVIRGVKISEQLFLADNSWGAGWGSQGSFEFSWDDMGRLLSEQGDATVGVPLSAPAPTPVPVASFDQLLWDGGPGQQLPGGLKAWCAEHRTREDLRQLKDDALAWAGAKGLS